MHRWLLNALVRVCLLSAGWCGAGCADASHEQNPELVRALIVNGQRSIAADDAVVQLTTAPPNSTPAACSGVLVAPNLVLTAVHCVAQYGGGTFSCNSDGTLAATSPGDGSIGELASPDQIAVHGGVFPGLEADALGVEVFGTGTNQVCRNDLALIVLDRDLPLPIASLRLKAGVSLGEPMRAIGYGATEVSGSAGRFERNHLRIIDRGQDAGGATPSSASPRTFVVGEGPCYGDSGGPIFSEQTGAVVGVYSLSAAASCTAVGARNVYTRLAPFADLVDAAFAFIGGAPLKEAAVGGGASPGGASNSGASGGPEISSLAGTFGGGSRPGGSGSSQNAGCGCHAAGSAPIPRVGLGSWIALLGLLRLRRSLRRDAKPARASA